MSWYISKRFPYFSTMASRPSLRDGVGEVQVDAVSKRTHSAALVDDRLGVPRSDVAGNEISEARIARLEVVVALALGDVPGGARVAGALRDPDAAVVPQRLAHERELRLVLARLRNAGGVDLGEAGVREERTPSMGPPDRGGVAALGVGREEVHVAVAARRQHHRVPGVGPHLARDHVAHHDASRPAVVDDEVQHLGAREHLDGLRLDLTRERLIGAEEKLLAGLAAGVERPRHLSSSERAVVELSSVLARERNALGDRLIDDRRD